MADEPTSRYWLIGFSTLVSLVGISIFISNSSTSRETWSNANFGTFVPPPTPPRLFPYVHHYPGVIIGDGVSGQAFDQVLDIASLNLISAPAKEIHPTSPSYHDFFAVSSMLCATLPSGELYIRRRRGVNYNSCGRSLRVYFPGPVEAKALGCDRVQDWAGYVCVDDRDSSKRWIEKRCPLWEETPICNLGKSEPCHPHADDAGCAEGISPLDVNGTCEHSCLTGKLLDANAFFEPTCPRPGAVLERPPCFEKCKTNPEDFGGESFSIECGEVAPLTEKDACSIVPELWTKTCSRSKTTCGRDNRDVTCRELTCPSDMIGRGAPESSVGTYVIPQCPPGFSPTVERVHCGLDGWSHENICRPKRPPQYRISRTPCKAGRRTVFRLVSDLGHPPIKTGTTSTAKQVACDVQCCPEGGLYASETSRGTRVCECALSRFGFYVDASSRRGCCLAPDGWNAEQGTSFRNEHSFKMGALEFPCKELPCTVKECAENVGGCMAFSGTMLYLRPDAPNVQPELPVVYTATNVVVMDYISA